MQRQQNRLWHTAETAARQCHTDVGFVVVVDDAVVVANVFVIVAIACAVYAMLTVLLVCKIAHDLTFLTIAKLLQQQQWQNQMSSNKLQWLVTFSCDRQRITVCRVPTTAPYLTIPKGSNETSQTKSSTIATTQTTPLQHRSYQIPYSYRY